MNNRKTYVAGIAAVCGSILLGAGIIAQDPEMQPPMGNEEHMKMRQAWEDYRAPSTQHDQLARQVGTWDLDVSFWMTPDAPPEQSKAVATIEKSMDGLFIIEKVEGETMEMPFRGMGVNGYDKLINKYVSIWFDNMGSGITRYEGVAADAAGKVITFTGPAPDFLNGKYVNHRVVLKWVDDDTMAYTSYAKDLDGQEYRNMVITYTRRK